MTNKPKHNCYAHCIAGLVLTIGCGSASSGATPCDGDLVQCSSLALAEAEDVLVEDVPAIKPTWIKPLPITDSAAEQSADWRYAQLSSDRDGKLWLFDREEAGVRVSRLSDEGEILDSTHVTPPQGLKTPLISLAVNAAWETGREPSSKLVWTRGDGCDQTVARTPGCSSENEKVIFDRGLEEEPLRVPLIESLLSDGFVNARGELFYVASSWDELPSIAKLDRATRNPLWKQSDFQTVSKEYDLTAAALDDGQTAVMRHSAAAYLNSIVFHWLDENGDGSDDQAAFSAQVDRASYRLLTTGTQPVVLYTDEIGDLHVQRMHRNVESTRSVTFLRQEYQSLDLRASAISPGGDVYIFTQSGRRDASLPTLCRAPEQGEGSCVTLPEDFRSGREEVSKLENLVARDGGVVFAQYGTQFLRLDFPE